MKAFSYQARRLARARRRRRGQARRQNHRRRHQPARPDEVAGRDADAAGRYQPAAARQDRGHFRTAACGRRAGAQQRSCGRPARAAALRRAEPRACWPAPARSCATRPPPAATCCSERAAIYFYDITKPCNKRAPGSGCAALAGFNRIHAILGASDAVHRHPSVRHGGGDAGARRQGGDGQRRGRAPASFRSPNFIAFPATPRRSRRRSSRAKSSPR